MNAVTSLVNCYLKGGVRSHYIFLTMLSPENLLKSDLVRVHPKI